MKICILTQPLGANYGGILQAYALQKVLNGQGHEVVTLRFRPSAPSWVPSGFKKQSLTFRRFISKYIKGNRSIIYCNPDKQTRFAYKELERFINDHIQYIPVNAPISEKTLPDFDAYIVGSDQVWRPQYSPFLPNFYLDFLSDANVKRIAYAASFGVDTWETDTEMTEQIRPLAQRFDAVSVREESGIALCREYLGINAEIMPDPTLLLTAKDYLQLCPPRERDEEAYIAAYILDMDINMQHFLDKMSKELGLPIRRIGQLDWIKGADSVENWILGISHASFVITDSFHGTVLSVIFKRNFVAIMNSERGGARFYSLLDSFGLQDKLIERDRLEDYSPTHKRPGFEKAEEALETMREKGSSFLRTHL